MRSVIVIICTYKIYRYDPKTGESASQTEFVTQPVPGHFWKLEAAPNGFTWAIGFDSNVWAYSLSNKHNKKNEREFKSDIFF
jgi:hypothetical protein